MNKCNTDTLRITGCKNTPSYGIFHRQNDMIKNKVDIKYYSKLFYNGETGKERYDRCWFNIFDNTNYFVNIFI